MRLALVAALGSLGLSACSGVELSQADGGRLRLNCTNSAMQALVTVLDAKGVPAPGAEVTASNATDGRKVAGTTNGSGVFPVPEEVGPGTIHVTATQGAFTTGQGDLTFTCGECDCAVSPRELTLQLEL